MKKSLIILFCFFSLSRVNAQSETDSTDAPGDIIRIVNDALDVDSMLKYAETFLRAPYQYGSAGPKSFDCSGYVMHVYGHFGVKLPHGSETIAALCDKIKLKDVQPGDLLFFAGRKASSSKIGHISIVYKVEKDEVTMIHATVQAGVIVEVMQQSEYFNKRFIRAGRLRALQKMAAE